MSGFITAAMVFAVVMSSALLAMFARRKLPDHHLSGDSKEVVRLATALIGTLARSAGRSSASPSGRGRPTA